MVKMKYFSILLLFFAPAALAETSANLTYTNISIFGQLILAASYMIGLFTFIGGIYSFYLGGKYGNDPSRSIGSSFAKVSAGAILLCSSTLYVIMKNSIGPTWTSTNERLALTSTAFEEFSATGFMAMVPDETVKTLGAAIWLIGLFGFLKGIYLIRFAADESNGSQGYSPKTKIFTHILGGIVLMNIKDAIDLASSFIGL